MKSPASTLSLILVPALVTLAVSILRVYGELQGWNPSLYNREAGGGGALVSITWLVLPIGFWIGYRMAKHSAVEVNLPIATATYAAAVALFGGGMFALIKLGWVDFPTDVDPGEAHGVGWMLGLGGVALVVALLAWRRLTLTMILYGILARLPVLVITWLDLDRNWDTHYGEAPPGLILNDESELIGALITPQLTLWPLVFTPVVGGVLGCVGARLALSQRGTSA